MAQEVKKEDGSVTFLNRGSRTFDLGSDKHGKHKRHAPNTTMAYTAEEAARHQGYPDLVDISKLPGQVDRKEAEAENKRLASENEELKKQLAALQPPAEPVKAKKKETVAA